jgi:hypothetical protein
MNYREIYYNEEAQKVKFTQSSTAEVPITFKYIGKMNQLELDVLIDFLWDIYQEKDISYREFKKHFDDFREFLDSKREIFKN